jgi:hypothetical protein
LEISELLLDLYGKERKLWSGFRNFGDYRMECGWFANCEFDPAYGLLKRFMLTGRFKDLRIAGYMLKHWLRFDRTDSVDKRFPPGIPWVHDLDHCSGKIEYGHMWLDGALLFYLLTGEEPYREAAETIGRFLAESRLDHPHKNIRERSAGWALIALSALKEAGSSDFDMAINHLAARIREKQSREGYFCFDVSSGEEGAYYAINTWVTAGITMEALFRHCVLTGDPRSLESLVLAAGWIKRSCRDRTTKRWFQNLHYAVEAPSHLMGRSGFVRKENAAFLALGLARAGQLSGDDKLLRVARCTLEEGLRTLAAEPPLCPGRALAVILRCAPEVILASCRD